MPERLYLYCGECGAPIARGDECDHAGSPAIGRKGQLTPQEVIVLQAGHAILRRVERQAGKEAATVGSRITLGGGDYGRMAEAAGQACRAVEHALTVAAVYMENEAAGAAVCP